MDGNNDTCYFRKQYVAYDIGVIQICYENTGLNIAMNIVQ